MISKKENFKPAINFLKKIPKWIILIILAAITILPLYFMVSLSFQSYQQAMSSPFLPRHFTLTNYIFALGKPEVQILFRNSVVVASVSTIGAVFISTLAGYGFGRTRFPFKNALYFLLIIGIAIPVQVTLIPIFQLLKTYHLLNTNLALIIPYIGFGIPFGTYIMTTFFKVLPKELEEAARIDGCNRWQIFSKVMLPLTTPAIAAVTIFLSLYYWNEFAFASVIVTKPAFRTLPLGLRDLSTQWYVDYSRQAAMLTIAAIPIVIIYLIFQRQFVKGLTAGAIKG